MAWIEWTKGDGNTPVVEVDILPGYNAPPLVDYIGLADTGSKVVVLPGRLIDVTAQVPVGGVKQALGDYRTAKLYNPNGGSTTVALTATGAKTRLRGLGDDKSQEYEVYAVSLRIDGTTYEDIDAVLMDQGPTRRYILLGRSLLFGNGGCSFDSAKRRLRVRRPWHWGVWSY